MCIRVNTAGTPELFMRQMSRAQCECRVWEECIGIEKTQNVHEEYNVANSTNGTCVAPRSLWHGHWRGWGNCKICKTPSPENGTWTHLSNGEWKEHFIFNPCSHPKLIFSPENAGNSVLESQIFKIFRGSMPPDPPSRLAPSALTLLETGHIFPGSAPGCYMWGCYFGVGVTFIELRNRQ